jgi:hypothetical protein
MFSLKHFELYPANLTVEEEEEELYYYCLDTIYFLQYLVTIIHLQLCSKIACIWIIVF